MQISRIIPLVPAIVGLAVMLGSGAASAQSRRQTAPGPSSGSTSGSTVFQEQSSGLPSVDASQNTRGTDNREIFRVLGFSGEIAAPVTPAYNDQAGYQTFAGQPARGPDAVLAQTIDGAP